jgi:hypothetical protein
MSTSTKEPSDSATAEEIAKSLFQIMVQDMAESTPPSQFGVPDSLRQEFHEKIQLYCEANVLLLLLSQAEKGKKYEQVLRAFEGRILPSRPSHYGATKLEVLKKAMKQISEVAQPQGEAKPLSWGMDWFADIGHEEVNPATLTLFAAYWISAFVAVGEAMKDFRPLLENSN